MKTIAVIFALIIFSISIHSSAQTYRYKAFETKVKYKNDQAYTQQEWKEVEIVIIIDLSKHKVKTFGNRELDIDIISGSNEYTIGDGNKAVDWIGIDKEGTKCYLTLIAYKDQTKKHIATLTIEYKTIDCEIYFRLMDDNV